MGTVLRVFSYLKRYPALASAQMACAIAATCLILVFPNLAQHVIDDVVPSGDRSLLVRAALLALLAFVARELFDALRIILNNTFEQKVIFDLRSDLYRKIQRLPLRWFDKKPTGDIMTRVSGDVTSMERVLIDGIEQGVVSLLQIIVIGTSLFWASPKLAAIALIPFPFLVLGAVLYTKGARERQRVVRKAASAMSSVLHDNLDGIRQIKAYAAEASELSRFQTVCEGVRTASLSVMKMWARYKPGMAVLSSMGTVLILYFGGAAIMDGEFTAGRLSKFLLMLGMFYNPVMRLHQLNQIAQAGAAAAERVFEIIDEEEEPGIGEGVTITGSKGRIEFHDVHFSYAEDGPPALESINLLAEAGQSIALVGSTGAGKSTIINLLTRFYEYDEGQILLDGRSIREIEKHSLRSQLGYVTQEAFLFNGTVRDNLLLSHAETSEERIWQCLEAAHAADFIKELPEQLDTIVGERGVRLSVGERQRLSVARALLDDPPILLLDEATASVDTKTERRMQEALDALMSNRTSIVIAHRLSTVQKADRIYVIEGGRVAESGTHSELIRMGGQYASLCQTSLVDS